MKRNGTNILNEEVGRRADVAKVFGGVAYARGVKCIPALDANVMPLMSGDVTPRDATSILKAWHAGWAEACIADN